MVRKTIETVFAVRPLELDVDGARGRGVDELDVLGRNVGRQVWSGAVGVCRVGHEEGLAADAGEVAPGKIEMCLSAILDGEGHTALVAVEIVTDRDGAKPFVATAIFRCAV